MLAQKPEVIITKLPSKSCVFSHWWMMNTNYQATISAKGLRDSSPRNENSLIIYSGVAGGNFVRAESNTVKVNSDRFLRRNLTTEKTLHASMLLVLAHPSARKPRHYKLTRNEVVFNCIGFGSNTFYPWDSRSVLWTQTLHPPLYRHSGE